MKLERPTFVRIPYIHVLVTREEDSRIKKLTRVRLLLWAI